MTKDEALRLALEVLGKAKRQIVHARVAPHGCIDEAITAIKETLVTKDVSLPEQEPVGWQWLDTANFRKKIPPAGESECWNPVYTSPPQRQPLTEEKQIAEDLRFYGLQLVKTVTGYAVLKLGQVAAHGIGDKT